MADIGIDPNAAPTYPELIELRADRAATMREFLAEVTAERLSEQRQGPSWDSGEPITVLRCLRVILNEECEHHRYAERDLDLIAG